ncbi:L-asparaginase [Streptomyces umbrinus]|uniref:L-asparaginase n=1 Tax=Streptomyces umbrinus TaxID=67370 RepID=A0ABU0T6S1_9ACTN|nr:asparaginase [Streptomyces umbrinus]MDQ1031498.1 L-asparaginase [Streptomyces umbrinus]
MPNALSDTERHIRVVSLGGTITMTNPSNQASGGATPTLTGSDLVGAVPELQDEAIITVDDYLQVPGASLAVEDIARLAERLHKATAEGATGIVVVQGTDTIEETAWLLDLLYQGAAPVVLTGAMRHASMPGADGPANLLSAVRTAGSSEARDLGVLVCFADHIHSARHVRKIHSTSTAAFASPSTGPIGHVTEGVAKIHYWFDRTPGVPLPLARPVSVEVVTAALGSTGALLDGLEAHVDGVVIAAFGAGHVPSCWVQRLQALATRIPVVLASRTGSGSVLSHTYGFAGSERDLLERGLISGGSLDPLKARMLLMAHLAAGSDRGTLRTAFARYS